MIETLESSTVLTCFLLCSPWALISASQIPDSAGCWQHLLSLLRARQGLVFSWAVRFYGESCYIHLTYLFNILIWNSYSAFSLMSLTLLKNYRPFKEDWGSSVQRPSVWFWDFLMHSKWCIFAWKLSHILRHNVYNDNWSLD